MGTSGVEGLVGCGDGGGEGRHLLLLRSGLWGLRWEEGRTWLGENWAGCCGMRRGVDGGKRARMSW